MSVECFSRKCPRLSVYVAMSTDASQGPVRTRLRRPDGSALLTLLRSDLVELKQLA